MFLSCLCGSELAFLDKEGLDYFLSCLCGSEPVKVPSGAVAAFSKLPVRQ